MMAKKEYNVITRRRAAKGRRGGGVSVMGSATTGGAVTGGGAVSVSPTPTGGDGHSHSNKELLDRLQGEEGGGYLYERVYNESGGEDGEGAYESRKVKAGWADDAGQAEDSEKWNGVEMSEMLDQPVRRGDAVEFGGLNCAGKLEGKILRVTEDAEVGGAMEIGGDATMNSNATVNGNATVGGKMDVTGDVSGANVVAQTLVKSPKIATPDFVANMLGGKGGGIYQLNGMTYAEVDYLTVRNGMSVMELLIQQYRAIGGSFVVSHANGEIESIYDYGNGYNIWIKNEDKAPRFKHKDLVRCQYFDWKTNEVVQYWVEVDVSAPNIYGREILTIYKNNLKGAVPRVGDKLVQMGNTSDKSRQGCILITTENSLPRIAVLDGIDKPEIENTKEGTNYRSIFGSLDGFTDPYTGKALSGYGLWGSNVYLNGEFRLASTGKSIEDIFNDISYQFTVVEGSLNSVQTSVQSLQTGGGRNLLLGTNQGSKGWTFWSGTIVPYISEYRDGVMFENINLLTDGGVFRFPLRPECIKVGRQYILSVDVTLGDAGDGDGQRLYLNIIKGNGVDSLLSSNVWSDKELRCGSTVHLQFPFTAMATGFNNGGQVVLLGIQSTCWSSLAFENLKLEEGTVATPYSQAPEDYVDGEVADVRTSITSIEQTTNSISARVEDVNTSLNGKIATNTASITANANAITSEVKARTEGDEQLASRITQTADSIALKVSELGLSNINHAIGTVATWVKNAGFKNISNETYKLYDVTGLSTGDVISFSCVCKFKGLVWGENAFISIQLSDVFGYIGLSGRITASSLPQPDGDGFYNIRVQATGKVIGKNYATGSNTTQSEVGFVYVGFNYISGTEDLNVFEISELKIERGNVITAWTARTSDLEQAMADTGIDIYNKRIIATADNFMVRNNNGEMTAHVDVNGNLSVGAIACRYPDSDRSLTPFIADWNSGNDGVQRWYYPDGSIRAEVGWDDATQSFIRKYSTDGDLLWKLGDPSEFQIHSEPIWVTVLLYYCGASYNNVPQSQASLPGTTYYRKTNTGNPDSNNVLYCDNIGTSPQTIPDGWYTNPGTPYMIVERARIGLEKHTQYSRVAYHYIAGKLTETKTITWYEFDNGLTI